MKKKLISVFLCAAMIGTMLTGCGGKAPEAASKTDTAPAEKTEAAEPAQEEKAEAPAEETAQVSGEIVYWSMWNETEIQAEILKNAIARFEEANPDCTVKVEWTGRDVKNLVIPAIESGTVVDIYDSDPTAIYNSDATKMANLDDFYQLPALNGTGTVKDSILGGLTAWDASLAEIAGLTGNYSVPYAPYTVSWFYNKDLFAQAGIEKVPATWAEFEEACAKLSAAGIAPITTDDAYISMIFSYYLQRAIGTEATGELASAGKELWDNEMVLQALTAMEDFASKGYFSKNVETNKYPAGQSEFAMGNVAMYLNASWFPSEVAEIAGDDFPWGQFAYPEVDGGKGVITENTIGGQAFMVNSKTENKDAVYELLKYFIAEDTQEEFLANGLVPCTTSTDWPATVSDQKEIVNQLTANVNWNASFSSDFVDGIANAEFIKVINKKQTAKDAWEFLKSEAQKY